MPDDERPQSLPWPRGNTKPLPKVKGRQPAPRNDGLLKTLKQGYDVLTGGAEVKRIGKDLKGGE